MRSKLAERELRVDEGGLGAAVRHTASKHEPQGARLMHVVIAGGGVAGLEALLALSDLAEGLVDVELVSPADEFVYRPMLVAEPFGAASALRIELERVARDTRAHHTKDALVSVDPGAHTITTTSSTTGV